MQTDTIIHGDTIYINDDLKPANINFTANGKSYRLHIYDFFVDLYEIFEDEDDILIESIKL
jgi:hypothetical protein